MFVECLISLLSVAEELPVLRTKRKGGGRLLASLPRRPGPGRRLEQLTDSGLSVGLCD